MANPQVVGEIIGDASRWNKASTDASAHASSLGGAFGKVGGTVKAAGLLMGGAALAAGAAFIAFGVHSISSAVEQERAWARVKSVFGKSSADVVKWSETNSRAFGVTDDTLEISVSKYVAWAQHAGMSSKEATSAAESMAKRASEISLATGKSYDEVFAALQKGTQGAVKGVKEFGVSLDKGSIAQYAYSHGIAETGSKLTAAQSALARQGMILQQTTSYTKDAAAMSGGFADSQRKMGVIIDEVQDNIGAAFLKVATAVMPVILAAFSALSDAVNTAMPTIQAVVSGTAAAIGTAFSFVAKNVIPVLQTAFAFIATSVVPALSAAFASISATLTPIVSGVIPQLAAGFAAVANAITSSVGPAIDWIKKNLDIVGPVLAGIATAVLFGVVIPAIIAWAAATWTAVAAQAALIATTLIAAAPFIAVGAAVAGVIFVLGKLGILDIIGAKIGEISKVVLPAMGAAFNVVSGVVGAVAAAIGSHIQVVAGVIGTAFGFVSRTILPALSVAFHIAGAAIGVVAGVIETVIRAIAPVVNTVFAVVGNVIGAFVAAVQRNFAIVGTAIGVLGTVFGALGTIIGRVFGAISGIVKGAFNLVIGLVNGIIRAIDSINFHVKIDLGPLGVQRFDWNGFGIGTIPYLHQGGIIPGSPGADVLVMGQAGERILPANQAGGGGHTFNFYGPIVGLSGMEEVMEMIAQRIRLVGATR